MKKNIIKTTSLRTILFLGVITVIFYSCKKENGQTEQTRLFRPVLNLPLSVQGNAIIVNMGSLKDAVSYSIEVSRDTFRTIDYKIQSDTSYVILDSTTLGDDLYWNTLYQVRATAISADTTYNSKTADLGFVKTDRFPTILHIPTAFDVIDTAARVTWDVTGLPVTGIKVFAPDDLQLKHPSFPETVVDANGQTSGEFIVTGLAPSTTYQIAIYSGSKIRGWVNYTTKPAQISPTAPGVIDLTQSTDPDALKNAIATAPDDATILLKHDGFYNAPDGTYDKSVNIVGAYGFGSLKAELLVGGSANVASGANIDHLHFKNITIKSNNSSYFMYFTNSSSTVGEIRFDDCNILDTRAVLKQKGTDAVVNNFIFDNCYIDGGNSYGILYTDGATGEAINNVQFLNSTITHAYYLVYFKNDSQTFLIDGCTIANCQSGRQLFRMDSHDVTGGVTISNTIFGHALNNTEVKGKSGLDNTTFTVTNTYTVTDFSWAPGSEIAGVPIGSAGSAQLDLWVDPNNPETHDNDNNVSDISYPLSDFHFKDSNFPGKYDSGDPRWREKL